MNNKSFAKYILGERLCSFLGKGEENSFGLSTERKTHLNILRNDALNGGMKLVNAKYIKIEDRELAKDFLEIRGSYCL